MTLWLKSWKKQHIKEYSWPIEHNKTKTDQTKIKGAPVPKACGNNLNNPKGESMQISLRRSFWRAGIATSLQYTSSHEHPMRFAEHLNVMCISSFFLTVDDSAILDCQFSDFCHAAPAGFEKILFEQQIFWRFLLQIY